MKGPGLQGSRTSLSCRGEDRSAPGGDRGEGARPRILPPPTSRRSDSPSQSEVPSPEPAGCVLDSPSRRLGVQSQLSVWHAIRAPTWNPEAGASPSRLTPFSTGLRLAKSMFLRIIEGTTAWGCRRHMTRISCPSPACGTRRP